jgi:hypothetical protein
MDFKDVIEELLAGKNDATVPNGLSKACGLAAEALALVVWAETNVTEIVPLYGGKWRCYTILNKGMGDSILGAIRAAKEAYDAE